MNTTNRTKKIAIATAIAGTLVVGMFSAAPATAATSGQDQTALRDWFTSQGISSATQDALIAKLDSGKLLDSMSQSVQPTSSTSVETSTELVSRSVYPDGSVAVTSLETPETTSAGAKAGTRSLQPQQITGCKESNGGGYVVESNCKVEIATGPYDLWFNATYERYTGGAQIDTANKPNAVVKYGNLVAAPTVSIKRKKQNGSIEAYAQEHALYKSTSLGSSEDLYVSLRVTTSRAWTTNY
ncbi:hypothetical protein DEI97_003645 [Curtobacterium sp. MCLR17_032]|uniref:hypothetical protein n=1 Tax=Curtobacterium sp. MCLR17_032 TaxID=2175650 RepID=UPI000DA9B4B3|nr:hypothetical protein [Curtobacterium sp. MCLR17_032]WIE62250.1 hypothetical protein DEI97_003645 [Curtobacterium sp. MCLR17_032]